MEVTRARIIGPPGILLRILTLRTHTARFGSLRQHAFGEIESLLRLGQLLPQLAYVGLERLDRLERVNRVGPRLDLPPTGTLAQPAGPPREPEREHHVDRGMRQLGLPDGEPGAHQVDDGQYSGDPEPRRGSEGHGEILLNDSSCAPAHNTLSPLRRSPPAGFKRWNLPGLPHWRAGEPRPRLMAGRRVKISTVVLVSELLTASGSACSVLPSSTADRLSRGRSRTERGVAPPATIRYHRVSPRSADWA